MNVFNTGEFQSYAKEFKAKITEINKVMSNSNFLKLLLLSFPFENPDLLDKNKKRLLHKSLKVYISSYYEKSDITIEGKEIKVDFEDDTYINLVNNLQINDKSLTKISLNNKEESLKESDKNDSTFIQSNEFHNKHITDNYQLSLTLSEDEDIYFKLDSFEKSKKQIKSRIICYLKKRKQKDLHNSIDINSNKKSKNNPKVENSSINSKSNKKFLLEEKSNSASFSSDSSDESLNKHESVRLLDNVNKIRNSFGKFEQNNQIIMSTDFETAILVFSFEISIYYYSSSRSILSFNAKAINCNNYLSYFNYKQSKFPKLNFSILEELINLIQTIPIVVNEESIIVNSYKQKIFEFISNFNNIKTLNPSLTSFEIVDKILNKLTIRLDGQYQYNIEIKESKTPSYQLNSIFSEDWVLRYISKRLNAPSEDHEVMYTVKNISKNFCLLLLKFTFMNSISSEVFKEIKLQQTSNLISIKSFLEKS